MKIEEYLKRLSKRYKVSNSISKDIDKLNEDIKELKNINYKKKELTNKDLFILVIIASLLGILIGLMISLYGNFDKVMTIVFCLVGSLITGTVLDICVNKYINENYQKEKEIKREIRIKERELEVLEDNIDIAERLNEEIKDTLKYLPKLTNKKVFEKDFEINESFIDKLVVNNKLPLIGVLTLLVNGKIPPNDNEYQKLAHKRLIKEKAEAIYQEVLEYKLSETRVMYHKRKD